MKNILQITIIVIIGITVCTSAFTLSDIENHWANQFIVNLVERGSVNGYTDGSFKPSNSITRAEFTKILLAALGINAEINNNGHWASNYMKEAVKKGYVVDGEFDNIDKNITRGEIARIIARAMDEKYYNMNEYSSQIQDYNLIPQEYSEFVLKTYCAGIILGYEEGSFRYERSATRAEACVIVVRFLDKSKRKLPVLIKEDAVIKGGKVMPVEVEEVTSQYVTIIESLKNIEGNVKSMYVGDMGSLSIYYTSKGLADFNNVTLVIDTYINKIQSGTQYLINIKKIDKNTLKAVKEVLRKLFPQSYEIAYEEIFLLGDAKSETETMEFDSREFYANYVGQNSSIYVYVGTSEK